MNNFIDINPNIATTANVKESPVVSITNHKVVSASFLVKAGVSSRKANSASKSSADQEADEMERARQVYQEIKPRIINVLRMLADS